jgi:hypothetical protein
VNSDAEEMGWRDMKARFDPFWHLEQAAQCERTESWFAAAFHRGQLAENSPWDPIAWSTLARDCERLGDFRPARAVCDRLLQREPGLAPAYLPRATLRWRDGDHAGGWADLLRCAWYATAEHRDWTETAELASGRGTTPRTRGTGRAP